MIYTYFGFIEVRFAIFKFQVVVGCITHLTGVQIKQMIINLQIT